jgi:tRNA-dihydrouridine synthase
MDYYRRLVASEMPDAIGKMKQFASYFTHGVRNGGVLRREVHTARTTAEVLERVDAFFEPALRAASPVVASPLN